MTNKKQKKNNRFANFFNKSLQRQILIPFLTLIIIAGVSIGFISYTKSVSLTTNELTDNVKGQTKILNDSFETFFDTQEAILNHYTEQSEFTNFVSSGSELADSLLDIASSSDSIKAAYLANADNRKLVTYPELDLPPDFDPRTRPWYKQAVENSGEVAWTEPYVDKDTGELIVSAAKSVTKNNQVIGVLSIDINMQSILDMVSSVKIGETGYAAIMSQSGIFISHPDKAYIGKDISDQAYFTKILNQNSKSGTVAYTFEGKEKSLGYTTNDRVSWYIVGTVNKSELAQKAKPVLIPIAITILIVLILSIFITLFITKRITKPIRKLQGKMKKVEEGDLSIDLTINSTNEIGQLSESIEEMKDSLRTIIRHVSEATTSVSSQSAQLTASANEVKEGSQQIASTMQELSAGSEAQANSSASLSEMMGEFVINIDQANKSGEEISDTSEEVLTMTEKGSNLMGQSVDQMKNIEQIVKDAANKVQGLDKQSKEISKLVQVINDIAEQTNLLSLNAAIEAARAGEHGKGFAVVADEVRKLADQVSKSVVDITGIVNNIQNESDMVAQSLQAGSKEVDQGSKQIQITGETFHNIQDSVTAMVEKIKGISNNLSEVAVNSDEMNKSIQEIAAVSEESAAGVEQVSASAQQSSSSMEEISTSSVELSELANELNDVVRKFTV